MVVRLFAVRFSDTRLMIVLVTNSKLKEFNVAQSSAAPAARVKRPMSSAAQIRRESNIAAAQERLERLQRIQRQAKEIRQNLGWIGNDHDLVARFAAHQKDEKTRKWVDAMMNSSIGRLLYRWLGDRAGQSPANVKGLIIGFLGRERNHTLCGQVMSELGMTHLHTLPEYEDVWHQMEAAA